MPATNLPITTPANAWSTTGIALTMTAIDNANGNEFVAVRDGLLIAHNTDASPHTLTVTSEPLAPSGRVDDISQSIAAGAIRIFRLARNGWEDSNGKVQLPAGQDATIEVGIVDLSS